MLGLQLGDVPLALWPANGKVRERCAAGAHVCEGDILDVGGNGSVRVGACSLK